MSDKLHPIPQALRDAIRNRQVVVVVGAGVSIQATGNAQAASWKGLIRLGIEACPRWNSELNKAWEKRKLDELQSADRIGLIGLADEVRRRIGTTNGRLEEWLRETVGQLKVKTPAILDALHALGCPIVTTNYDGLLDRNGLSAVTWQQAGPVDRIIRGEDKGIIHLHGRFDEPDSVVLGIEDYAAVRDGAFAKAVREALAMTRTLLFVGCGDGLSDPNFTTFRRWMATVLSNRSSSHYRLCRDDERQALEKEHDAGERIDLVPYGKHEHLVGLLQSLASVPVRSPKPAKGMGRPPVRIRGGSKTTVPAPALGAYLKVLRRQVARIELVGFGATLRIDLPIEKAYVPLRLYSTSMLDGDADSRDRKGKAAPNRLADINVPVASVFRRAQQMGERGVLILGDPGSGKTTAARQWCHALLAGEDAASAMGLPKGMVPVLIRLRDLPLDQASNLWDFIEAHLKSCVEGMDDAGAGDPASELKGRGGVLWIFDGLDEVVDETTRAGVAAWIAGFLDHRDDDRFLVTSRYSGYVREVSLGPRFCVFNVQALDESQVRDFVHQWHGAVWRRLQGEGPEADQSAAKASSGLLSILSEPEYRIGRLRELPGNPLLLTILCLVHHDDGDLPGRRADLYARCVRVLVEEWRKHLIERKLVPKFDPVAAEDVLGAIAWWLHAADKRTSDEIESLGAITSPVLATVSPTAGLGVDGKAFVVRMRDFSGILAPAGPGRVGFLHLTFQEYLAAYRASRGGMSKELARHLGKPWWREATLLAMAIASPEFSKAFFTTVASSPRRVAEHEDFIRQMLDESRHPVVDAFVRALTKPGTSSSERLALLRVLRGRSSKGLLKACRELAHGQDLAVAELAAELLQLAGEAPVNVHRLTRGAAVNRTLHIDPKTGMAFVDVPAGEFLMGSEAGHYDDESPIHPVRVSAFRMGRYPVTNAEYAKFLAAHPGAPKPRYWDDSQFNDPRQPVVSIDWDQASEFCRWLGGRLPTEAEWEYACRAGTTTEYAFGPELRHEQANFGMKVGRTTPVDQHSANPWGLHDMHGNVWEWCADWYGKKYYESSPALDPQGPEGGEGRVLRGGSWYNSAVHCRSACRNDRRPGVRNPDGGFRVVLASRSAS